MRYQNIFNPPFIASIITIVAMTVAISFLSLTTNAKAQDQRPNIVMIVVDDMSYSDLDFYGGEIETPALSSLANEGVRFTNFHAGSICSPSRAMFNTGVDNHRNGMGTMFESLTDNQRGQPGYEGYMNNRVVTTATLLKEAGYHTYMVGKWHLGGAEGPESGKLPVQRGFEKSFALLDGASDFYSNRGISNFSQCVKYVVNNQQLEEPDFPPGVPFYQCKEVPLSAERERRNIDPDHFPPHPEKSSGYVTKDLTDQMIKYLEADKEDGKPFFAFVSYTAPHYPLQVPHEYVKKEDVKFYFDKGWDILRKERFKRMKKMGIIPADMPFPPSWPEVLEPDNEDKTVIVEKWNSLNKKEQFQEAVERAVYAGMLKYLDEQINRIIDKVKELGKYENTMIIFFSDNGGDAHDKDTKPAFKALLKEGGIDNSIQFENFKNLETGELKKPLEKPLGGPLSWLTLTPGWTQLGMTPFWGEKSTQTEGGVRAAFFVHYPKLKFKKQSLSHAFISVLDLTPTILDYAGVEHPGILYKNRFVFPLDGKSMRPIWEGWQTDIYRDNEPIGFEVLGQANNNKSLYLGDYKISQQGKPWGNGTWKLFNLAIDMAEQNDLSEQEPEKKAEMLALYNEFETDVGFVPACNYSVKKGKVCSKEQLSYKPTSQTFKRPDARLTLHTDNVDKLPELPLIYQGVKFQPEQYVTVFKSIGEISAHLVWGKDDNGEEVLYAFKSEDEVLTHLNKKQIAKNLNQSLNMPSSPVKFEEKAHTHLDQKTVNTFNKSTLKEISQFPVVDEKGTLFRPGEYRAHHGQKFQALGLRYGYPVVYTFSSQEQLKAHYQTAQDQRCQRVLANNVKEKTDSPLTVDVYWAGKEGHYASSLLIQGKKEAILVGAQNTPSEGKKVAEWVTESGKTLKAIWISHAHPERILGLPAILRQFPGTPVYATPGVVGEIKQIQPKLDKVLTPYKQGYLALEDQCIEIMPFKNIDGVQNYTTLYIHSTQTLFAADIVSRGGHLLLTPPAQSWIAIINQLKAKNPKQVITGQAAPACRGERGPEVFDDTLNYIARYSRIVNGDAESTRIIARQERSCIPSITDRDTDIPEQVESCQLDKTQLNNISPILASGNVTVDKACEYIRYTYPYYVLTDKLEESLSAYYNSTD